MKVIDNLGDVHSALRECTLDERLEVLQFLLYGAQLYTTIYDNERGIKTSVYNLVDECCVYMTGLQVTLGHKMDYQEIKYNIESRDDE